MCSCHQLIASSLPSRGFWWQWCGSISIIVDFVLNTCPILLNHAHIFNPQTTFTESYILMSLTFLEEPSLNSLSLTLSNYLILSNTSVSPSAKSMSISFPFLDHSFLLTCCTFLISHTMFPFKTCTSCDIQAFALTLLAYYSCPVQIFTFSSSVPNSYNFCLSIISSSTPSTLSFWHTSYTLKLNVLDQASMYTSFILDCLDASSAEQFDPISCL